MVKCIIMGEAVDRSVYHLRKHSDLWKPVVGKWEEFKSGVKLRTAHVVHSYLSEKMIQEGIFSEILLVPLDKIVSHEKPDPERVFEDVDLTSGWGGEPLMVSLAKKDDLSVRVPDDARGTVIIPKEDELIVLHDGANRLSQITGLARFAMKLGLIESLSEVLIPVQFIDFYNEVVCLDVYKGVKITKSKVIEAAISQDLVEPKQTAHTLRIDLSVDEESFGDIQLDNESSLLLPVSWAQPKVVMLLRTLLNTKLFNKIAKSPKTKA